MAHPETAAEQGYNAGETVLDQYITATALGTEFRYMIAQQQWTLLSDEQQRELQHASRKIAGGNLALSESYTQSILLLQWLNANAELAAAAQLMPNASGGDASGWQPAA